MTASPLRFLLLVVGLVLLAAPAHALDDSDFAGLNAALTDAVVVPGYERHAEATVALAGALDRYCAADANDELETVTQAFEAAMDSWQHIQPIAFGPIMQGAGPARVQFWPDKRGTGARQLRAALAAEDPSLLEAGALAGKSVALGDLQALERVIYDSAGAPPEPGGYRCMLATAIAHYQAGLATGLRDGWSAPGGFRESVLSAAHGNDAYFDAAEAAQDFLKSLAGTLDAMIALKLERPLGETLERARPKRAESWRSGRSLANIAANLETARALYATKGGFADLQRKVGSGALADGMVATFDEAIALARGIDAPLREAVGQAEGRAQVETLRGRLKGLRLMVQSFLARDLGLVAGFNASDGD